MSNIVLADNDDEYLTFNDFQMYNAFKYWNTYGLSYSNQTSYTNTINSIYSGTSEGSFTFTGSFGGSFESSVKLAISGLTSTDLDSVDDILSAHTFYYFADGSESDPLIEMSISSGTDEGEIYNPIYSCVYNPNSTSSNSVMTCTPNTFDGAFTIPDQDIKVTSIDMNMNSITEYDLTLTLRNENTVVGTLLGSLSLTGSGLGAFNLTENGTTISTSVNVNSLQYVLPILKGSSIDNSYVSSKRISVPAGTSGDTFCIAILTPDGSHLFNFYDGAWTSTNILRDDIVMTFNDPVYYKGGMNLYYIELKTNSSNYRTCYLHWTYLNRMFNVNGLIPLYVGLKSNMTDDMYRFIFGEDRLLNLLENGNNLSANAENNLNHSDTDFNSVSDDLVDLENNTFSGVDNAINNVNLNSNILSFDGFLNAANWVRIQFDNLVSDQGFNNILVFSLSLGFALLIIGKVR